MADLFQHLTERLKTAAANSTATRQPKYKCRVCGKELYDPSCTRKCSNVELARNLDERAAREAKIPLLYRHACLTDFSGLAQADEAKAIATINAGGGIFLSGTTGIGKTHMAAALARAVLAGFATEYGYDFTWVLAPDLLMEIRETYGGNGGPSEREVVLGFRQRGLLVIDDLGAEKMTDWSISALYSVIAGRIDECRPTIITSNLGLRQIHEWEPRIASRLAAFHSMKLPEADRRLLSAKKPKTGKDTQLSSNAPTSDLCAKFEAF